MAWEFDRNHSRVGFSARHLGINTVHGQFEDADVALNIDGDDPVNWSVKANIKAASINTGLGRRDDALRSDQYLNVEAHPTITFESSRVERRGDQYAVIGALTMLGVTKEVELEASFNGEAVDREQLKRGFSARGTIDRFAFGIGEPERTWTVGPKIDLVLDMEAIKQS